MREKVPDRSQIVLFVFEEGLQVGFDQVHVEPGLLVKLFVQRIDQFEGALQFVALTKQSLTSPISTDELKFLESVSIAKVVSANSISVLCKA